MYDVHTATSMPKSLHIPYLVTSEVVNRAQGNKNIVFVVPMEGEISFRMQFKREMLVSLDNIVQVRDHFRNLVRVRVHGKNRRLSALLPSDRP